MKKKEGAITRPTIEQLLVMYPIGSMVYVHNRSFIVKGFYMKTIYRDGRFGKNNKLAISVELGRPHLNGVMQKAGCATEFEKEVICNGFGTRI